MIIDILRGSNNAKIKNLNFDSLSVWGLMKETQAQRIRAILDFLIDERILETEGDEYPVIMLGSGYSDVLREERPVYMKLPKEQKPKEKKLMSGPQKILSKNTALTGDSDKVLFEKLKELRRELAIKENVPAYIVFSDASLRDMCLKRPLSLVQFSAVNGVGAVKLEKYGEIFVEAIKKQ
jgi:ATP-dependent DNA helicase RecQ